MGLFILEDKHLEHVPGTATLEDLDEVASAAREHHGDTEVKKSKDGIILVPQPSEDPNGKVKNMKMSRERPYFISTATRLLD